MGIIQDAINDAADFTSNSDDFGIPITLTAPDGQVANIYGTGKNINLNLDIRTGILAKSQTVTVTFSEKVINTANPNYIIRNIKPESEQYQKVEMEGHIVEVADSTGVIKKYQVIEVDPDNTLGLIVLTLSNYRE